MPLHDFTPLIESLSIGSRLGKSVFLKMDCFQSAGSFKIRGIGRLCEDFVKRGITHFVSSSGGNAGYATAFAGRKLGARVTVIVPESTAEGVRQRIRELGAEVREHGKVWDEADGEARRVAAAPGFGYVPPFDHPTLWDGHATLIDEVRAQGSEPDAVVVAVGGGGLLCGVLEGLHRNGWAHVPVIAAETRGAASFAASLKAGRVVEIPEIRSVATTLGARKVAEAAFAWSRRHKVISHVVSDKDALDACVRFATDHRSLVEPACGAALTAVYNRTEVIAPFSRVLVVVCGGIGTDRFRVLPE